MKKGFTLVELLAVIVILAVIALITIPAVMRMIESSTINSYRRSVDLYGKAVNNAVIEYQTDMVEKGQPSNVTFDNIEPYIEYEGNDIDCKIKQIYSDKTILLTECYVDEELVSAEKNRGYSDNNYYYYTNSKKKIKAIEYIKAVEEEIKDKNINGVCTISEDKITCNGQDLTIKSNLENAIEGTLTIENSKVKSYSNLKFETEKKVETNNEVPQIIDEIITTNNDENNNNQNANNGDQNFSIHICKSKNGNTSTELGTEYECEVKEGTKFNFYVLSKEGDNVNLIMDRNICDDGTTNYSSLNNYCRYEWHPHVTIESSNYTFGPDIAMIALYQGTKAWSNIPDIMIDYNQDTDGYVSNNSFGYKKIVTEPNTKKTKILKKDDTVLTEIGTSRYPLKARLATKKEMTDIGCTEVSNSCPYWVTNNLEQEKVNGYWLLTIKEIIDRGSYVSIDIYNISYSNLLNSESYSDYSINGIRPVITVPISYLQ